MDRNPIFFDYLKTGLFDIVDDDKRVEQLTASVDELVKQLVDDPEQVRCHTLVALDADIPVDNPIILATYEIVKTHWKGIEGKYADVPRNILRGVILSALYELGAEDAELCRVVFYTASGYSQFVRFGREQAVVERMLSEFGDNVEKEAMAEWSLAEEPTTPKLDTFKLKDFKLGAAKVDSNTLEASLKSAAGPEPTTTYASFHQNETYNKAWTTHFAKAASSGIVKAIEASIQDFGQTLSTKALENEINKFFTSVSTSLTTTLKVSFQSLVAVERRSKLLWWKETLYSTTLGKSYREIDAAILPVVMALDLAKMLPDVTPASVDYLLMDTYRAVVNGPSEKKPLPELLAPFGKREWQKLLAPLLPSMTDCGERTTLTSFLAQVLKNQRVPTALTEYTGLQDEAEASPDQLAVLVLHDLLTERLISPANAA